MKVYREHRYHSHINNGDDNRLHRFNLEKKVIAVLVFVKPLAGLSEQRMKKSQLPTKICLQCQRPFAWRKKWERCWAEVKYCSDACKKSKPR
jgi:hypothetical protein